MRARNRRGFTLLEVMVVVVVVGMLASAAVPVYLNYVKDSRRAEARGGLGAIQTGEQSFYQKNGGATYKNATSNAAIIDSLHVDLTDPGANWSFKVTGASASGYVIDATGKAGTPAAGLHLQMVYDRTSGVAVTDIS